MKMKSESEAAQLCPTLSDPMDCSPPGSSIHGIFQARVLEWGTIAFTVYIYALVYDICFSDWVVFVILSSISVVRSPVPPDLMLILLACFFGEGNGSPLQYACLENPMDVGAS